MVDGRNFFDWAIKNDEITCVKIWKITNVHGDIIQLVVC